jgi:DNA-binding Xre family transcriptional regulator
MDKREFTSKIGMKIREIRNGIGISQTELGRRIGKDQQHIQLIETGKTTCTSFTLFLICEALECDVNEILQFS